MIKAASGESQFHAIVRGIATALDMKSAKRYGHEVKVVIETDAVDGRGVSLRLSAGKERHADTQWSWLQGVFHRREATTREIPGISNEADLMTNS